MSEEYVALSSISLDNIVWAKEVGYPWWPGIVTHVSEGDNPIYRVYLFEKGEE